MIAFLIFISIYIIGFFISLWLCHKYKDKLDINSYDHPHGIWYDDYQSNAEAYVGFSSLWPLFWIVMLFTFIYRLILRISENIDDSVKAVSNTITKTEDKPLDKYIDNEITKYHIDIPAEVESAESIILRFLAAGVKRESIKDFTSAPNCIWSKTRKCMAEGVGQPLAEEFIQINNFESKLTDENNVLLNSVLYSTLDDDIVNQINNSNGIIISTCLYGRDGFRFMQIP